MALTLLVDKLICSLTDCLTDLGNVEKKKKITTMTTTTDGAK